VFGSIVETVISGAEVLHAGVLQKLVSSFLVPLRIEAAAGSPFRAHVKHADVGPMVVARVRSTPHAVVRRPGAITSTDRELFKLVLHRRGGLDVAQADHRARMRPGDIVIFDATRPYNVTAPDSCDVVVVGVPRAAFGSRADAVARHGARVLPADRGTRSVIASVLTGLADHLDELPGPGGVRIADAMTSLIVAAFTDSTPERVDSGTEFADRILAYTLANLDDPTLSAESVAARHGISVRHLHTLLRHRDVTFAAWVRSERLRRIRSDLLDPTLADRTTASIAARWGLHDSAHLSRALKREYGQTAADLRRELRRGGYSPR
jgi:AraC-like DNA-binding protein